MLTWTRIGARQRVAIVAVISFGAATFAQAHSFPTQPQTVSVPDTVLECHHQYGASYMHMHFCVNSTKANSPERIYNYKNGKSKIKEFFIVIGPATPLVGS